MSQRFRVKRDGKDCGYVQFDGVNFIGGLDCEEWTGVREIVRPFHAEVPRVDGKVVLSYFVTGAMTKTERISQTFPERDSAIRWVAMADDVVPLVDGE